MGSKKIIIIVVFHFIYLRDNGDAGTQIMETKFTCIDAVNGDLSSCRLDDAEQGQC